MRLPGADAAANAFEHFVHHEDVRRAGTAWTIRNLSDTDQRDLWQHLTRRVRLYVRRSPVPVRLVAAEFGAISVQDTDDATAVTLTGSPAELVLYLHGRRDQAEVSIEGPDESVTRWRNHTLRV
jgi:uncharacterized protein (TIGR03085 family)